MRDIVADGENGYLTEEDERRWAGKITALLSDEALMGQMRQAAKRTAERYSEEEVARCAERYYRKVYVTGTTAGERTATEVPLPRHYVI